MKKPKAPPKEAHIAVVAAVAVATETKTPRGKDLLPPELAKKISRGEGEATAQAKRQVACPQDRKSSALAP